jgi:hypothetical protein
MALADELPYPPDHLPLDLPIKQIDPGMQWWRIHKSTNAPIFFGPATTTPPVYRFDAPGGEYRTLYLGKDFSAAFVETLLRNPRVPFVELAEIELRSVSVLTNNHSLVMIDLCGQGLSRIGVDNRLATGSYEKAGQWALKLWGNAARPDGLLYRSKHNPEYICAAVFDRKHCTFCEASTEALKDIPHRWAPILSAHGKGIA